MPQVPQGFSLTGVPCGIKTVAGAEDLTLIRSDGPATAAGVYTTNLVCAAPVVLDRQRTPSDRIRLIVANSGNANACTGERGMRDAEEMGRLAAEACGADDAEALVLSTGIIGEFLPMEKVVAGIAAAAGALGCDEASLLAAARGIMTTDTVLKLAGRSVSVAGADVRITGMAKGAGMIDPRMATMLGIVLTDAALEPADAQAMLAEVADETFNCISVDGHTSTNDTLLLLANGAAGVRPPEGDERTAFRQALAEVCEELARSIPADGEGATHLITIDVAGCALPADARRIAKTVADSPLVKTAVAGADPNWGRIVSAVGYAGVPCDPSGIRLRINGTLLYEKGAPVPFDAAAASESIRNQRETLIELELQEGDAKARFWTCDLTAQYVSINADYHT